MSDPHQMIATSQPWPSPESLWSKSVIVSYNISDWNTVVFTSCFSQPLHHFSKIVSLFLTEWVITFLRKWHRALCDRLHTPSCLGKEPRVSKLSSDLFIHHRKLHMVYGEWCPFVYIEQFLLLHGEAMGWSGDRQRVQGVIWVMGCVGGNGGSGKGVG